MRFLYVTYARSNLSDKMKVILKSINLFTRSDKINLKKVKKLLIKKSMKSPF